MGKKLLKSTIVFYFLIYGCSNSSSEKEKIVLTFQPKVGSKIQIDYSFTVNSVSSKAVTTFNILARGNTNTNEKKDIILDLKNNDILLDAIIDGKKFLGSSNKIDSLNEEVKAIALPVFGVANKFYRTTYDSQFHKKSEIETDAAGNLIDTTENRIQFLINYPDNEIAVGDKWEKELLIKAGNKMNCSATYTLDSIFDNSAKITIQGKLYGKGESFGYKFDIAGELKGYFIVNKETGMPILANITEDFTIDMNEQKHPISYVIIYSIK